MCGIVGYIGKKEAYPILIKGLKRLEYRGYHSAGVALISNNQQLNVYKTKGKVSELENFVTQKDISGNIGIVHTRWATHGEPCSVNAHPHFSSSETLALIHNGIIENYAAFKEKLQAKGYTFKSSTDTEVLVQLIEYMKVTNNLDLLAAVELARSRGAFIYGVCNAIGSSIPRATHTGSYIHVGPEIGVASIKAFTGQVTVFTLLALTLAREKQTIDEAHFLSVVHESSRIPEKMEKVLKLNDKIAELSKIFTYAHNFIYLGRGYSYIHAEGYPATEMKHGPIALINAEMPVAVIATQNGMYEKVLPLITTMLLQLLAYHVAVCKGMNVDQPINLAKSVTVE